MNMSNSENFSSISSIDDEKLRNELLMDPGAKELWLNIAHDSPEFANWLAKTAYLMSIGEHEVQEKLLNIGSYVYRIFQIAHERTTEESQQSIEKPISTNIQFKSEPSSD